ncbi:MAG: transposase [Nitrospinae bacterium]|nr:transposase [Nitrospinota bacterium]
MRQAYFITSTINQWAHLFHRKEMAGIILESLSTRAQQGKIKINGYVIMPNHIHMIITINEGNVLADFLRDFHKYTAKKIIETLNRDNDPLLSRFTVEKRDRKIQIWQKTHSPKKLISWEFLKQKLEYIHNNPLAKKWRLCDRPENFAWSSARDYLGQSGPLPVEVVSPWTPWD